MTKIFYDFDDVIVYVDNIILFTQISFEHYVTQLSLVLERIKAQNLHLHVHVYVHVEETFLASQEVDYLGYTLSSKGIKPQYKKIMATLALDELKKAKSNEEVLYAFLILIANFGTIGPMWLLPSQPLPGKMPNGHGIPNIKKPFHGFKAPLRNKFY